MNTGNITILCPNSEPIAFVISEKMEVNDWQNLKSNINLQPYSYFINDVILSTDLDYFIFNDQNPIYFVR